MRPQGAAVAERLRDVKGELVLRDRAEIVCHAAIIV